MTGMTDEKIVFMRKTFDLRPKDLAKALNVSPLTVARWEQGQSVPTGLQEEVLLALYNTALTLREAKDETQAEMVGGLVRLGMGALLFYLMRSVVVSGGLATGIVQLGQRNLELNDSGEPGLCPG